MGSTSPSRGETLGLVGESGCGKTTTTKLILAAEEPTAGAIEFEGAISSGSQCKDLMDYRRKVQIVFQDPFSSLSPRMRMGDIIGEPVVTHERVSRGRKCVARVAELLELVGLRPDMARLFPHEFSGGQRQRLAIARPCPPMRALSCSMSRYRLWTSLSGRTSSACWRKFKRG